MKPYVRPECVGEQVPDRYLPLRIAGRVVVGVAVLPHPEATEGGDELRDGVLQPEVTFLVEREHRHRRDRFGHREDPDERVLGHRSAGLGVAVTLHRQVGDLPATADQQGEARVEAGVEVPLLDERVDAGQPLGVEPEGRRIGHGQPVCLRGSHGSILATNPV